MSTTHGLEAIIQDLGKDLAPVRRLRPPPFRAAFWLGVVTILGVVLCFSADLGAVIRRLSATPDMGLAALGSSLTSLLGAVAVFELSLPDRRAAWAWLPVPGLVLWISASGMGCLRGWAIPGVQTASMSETRDCLAFILGLSVPLSALMLFMVRQAFTLRPGLTAVVAGLTSAAAAATLLNIFHPYDASATDLLVHLCAVALVIAANLILSGRLLTRPWTPGRRPNPSPS